MGDWFADAFGGAVADVRHELLGGWFGRTFEPHPMHQHGPEERSPAGERDIHGNEREIGIDR